MPHADALSAWDLRLIDVITNCEDDVKRYGRLIEAHNGPRAANAAVLARCMESGCAHRHLTLLTALHLIVQRFDRATPSVGSASADLQLILTQQRDHINLVGAMMRALFRQTERTLIPGMPATSDWQYDDSVLAHLIERRLCIALADAMLALSEQFSCSLVTTLMAAVEPAMKSVQDRLTLRPELPLNVKAFAGSMLGLKHHDHHRQGESLNLSDLAADISQILRIPRTICLSA